jgi:hypothetical protein
MELRKSTKKYNSLTMAWTSVYANGPPFFCAQLNNKNKLGIKNN